MEKLEWFGYPTVKQSLTIRLAILTEYRHVTDRQTDGRTDILPRHYSPRYAYASRGNKYSRFVVKYFNDIRQVAASYTTTREYRLVLLV